MLSNKLKSLEKRLKEVAKHELSGVFIVTNVDGEYIIKTSTRKGPIYKGDKRGYEKFKDKYNQCVFIARGAFKG